MKNIIQIIRNNYISIKLNYLERLFESYSKNKNFDKCILILEKMKTLNNKIN